MPTLNPTLSLTISRGSLPGSPTPLVIAGSGDSTELMLEAYEEPAVLARNQYAPDSPDVDGAGVVIASSLQPTNLTFTVRPDRPASETVARQLVAALRDAVTRQLGFTIAVAVNGAPAETWSCTPGQITPAGGRDYVDLVWHNPAWVVTVPAHPVPTI